MKLMKMECILIRFGLLIVRVETAIATTIQSVIIIPKSLSNPHMKDTSIPTWAKSPAENPSAITTNPTKQQTRAFIRTQYKN